MKYVATTLYTTLIALYIAFTVALFPEFGISCAIPVIFIYALGAWLFGRTVGLLLMIPGIVYHAFLTSVLYADLLVYHEYKHAGISLIMLVIFMVGSFRNNYNAIKETNRTLDQLVETRNQQLHLLTTELLNSAERQRVARGQELHDGMGQQLTGIQLLSMSLLEQLKDETDHVRELAAMLHQQTATLHNHIRRIARMLFPIRISKVGLASALVELKSCILDISPVHFCIHEAEEIQDICESTSLQIFRICQETTIHLLETTDVTEINVSLNSTQKSYVLKIVHNGSESNAKNNEPLLKLIQYRLKKISGILTQSSENNGYSIISFDIPRTRYLT